MNEELAGANSVESEFYKPMVRALAEVAGKRECPEFTDEEFMKAGVGRCVNDVRSGRDWVQKAIMIFHMAITVSRFFIGLRSQRRLKLLQNVSTHVRIEGDSAAPLKDDPFAGHAELDPFGIYAADGHFHGSSAHDEHIDNTRYPAGYFFSMSLRTQTVNLLDIARPKVKKEQDITAMKRLEAEALRMGEPTGRKVILAYDPAIYDFAQWYNWKQSKGIYIITRMKENTKLRNCEHLEFDRTDKRNTGILSDLKGVTNCGRTLRKIVYKDPETGKIYIFLTNEMTLPPGLICFIYKKRWDIEKVFDQFKNKLMERKAWAKSLTAKCMQAQFMALTHNLTLLLERKLEAEEGIVDAKIEKKQAARTARQREQIQNAGRTENPLVTRPYKAVQRSFQFIRWLRCSLIKNTSWRPAIDALRPLMAAYLS